jgi:hypothetical protein
MNGEAVLTAPQIREYYAQAIRESGAGQLDYLTFFEWLRSRDLRPKGTDFKEQHRSFYNAVTGAHGFCEGLSRSVRPRPRPVSLSRDYLARHSDGVPRRVASRTRQE